jgi:metal-dependent HD superfamily phosphatase/phosphodiesterase
MSNFKTVSVTFARKHFFKILDDVYFNHTKYTITKNKIPMAIICHPNNKNDLENNSFSLKEILDHLRKQAT